MRWGRTKPPFVLNKLQMRLAIELAAQHAAQLEIKRQVEQQLPGKEVTVEGAWVDCHSLVWQSFTIDDREVVWE